MKKCLSGSALKIIAMVTMLIDHAGAVIVEYMIASSMYDEQTRAALTTLDKMLRGVGRTAFPLFAFLLVEGFVHTRSRVRYLIRLIVFALISEVPFDLAVYREVCHPEYQNVFFTLALGFLMMMGLEKVKTIKVGADGRPLGDVAQTVLKLIILIAASAASYLIKSDYIAVGVAVIALFYLLRDMPYGSVIAGGVGGLIVLSNPWTLLSLIPIALYNGERGLKLKWLFYIIYPAHLLLYWFIAVNTGV